MKLDFNDTVQMIWSDGINSLYQDHHHQEEKIVTSQAGSSEGFIGNSLLLCGKNVSKSYVDYQNDINCSVFEYWFENRFIPNLPKE